MVFMGQFGMLVAMAALAVAAPARPVPRGMIETEDPLVKGLARANLMRRCLIRYVERVDSVRPICGGGVLLEQYRFHGRCRVLLGRLLPRGAVRRSNDPI